VTNMENMFFLASAFAQELDVWDVGAVTDFDTMFQNSRMRAEAVSGGPALAAPAASTTRGRRKTPGGTR